MESPDVELFRVGQAAFSKIRWNEAGFRLAWTQFAGTSTQEPAAACDEYLRLACLAGAQGAVETLELQFIGPLRPVLERRCTDRELVDEALQQLRHKLLLGEQPRLLTYRSTGHLRAWLQVVAVRVCLDLARQRGARWQRESVLADDWPGGAGAPDVRLEKQELEAVFAKALHDVIRQLPARERYALRMHVLAGWNVSEIGEALGIHRASAARWIISAKEKINQSVRALLRERLDLSPSELDRLFELFSTQLDLRLSQVFNTTPALGQVNDPE